MRRSILIAWLAVLPLNAFADELALESLSVRDVKLAATDGKQYSISDVRGDQGTLVIFTCNHCPYVKAWESRTVKLGNDALAKGVGVIAINSNDDVSHPDDAFAPMVERAQALGLDYPYVVDATSEIARAFGATKTPEFFLFDAAGKLVYHGALDDDAEDEAKVTKTYLADAIAALLAGKPVAVAETKAFGCGIKLRK